MGARTYPNKKISLAILEDNENMLIGLKFQFEQSDIEICVASDDLEFFISKVGQDSPTVALIDLRMWQDSDGGLDAILKMRAICPNTFIVVYTAYASLENFHRAMELDVKGFLKKDQDVRPRTTLVEIVRMVANGGEFYDQELFKQYKNLIGQSGINTEKINSLQDTDLTDREMEVLRLIARNMNNQDIADQLTITIHTVKIHVQNIFKKLNVHTRRDALIIGKTRGVI